MRLNRVFLARVFALAMTLWSLPSTGFSQDSDSCDQQVNKYCRGDGETYQEAKAYMECLRRNRGKLSGECGTYIDEVLGEFERSKPCLEDYLKLCGIDLVRMQIREPRQGEEEKVHECRILKWDEFSAGCRQEYQDSMEALGWGEEEIKKEAARLKAREKVRGLVWVKGVLKPVMAEAREGDLIWYVAKVRKKKVLDRSPFCPKVKGQGLKLIDNPRMGICYYLVTAPWEKELIRKLEMANVMHDLPVWGGDTEAFGLFYKHPRR
mgnify:CR=1 FL=1